MFGQGVFAVLEGFLHFDRPSLAHGDGGVGRVLRQPERAFDPAFLRLTDENGDAVDFWIVVGFDDDFMIRPDQSCWRRTRFSASSRARRANRDRKASNSWVKNATIGRFSITRPFVRHQDRVFGEAQGFG